MSERCNLGIAWIWEFDKSFVYLLEKVFQEHGLSTYRVELHNAEETLRRLRRGDLVFDFYMDRAYDSNPAFLPLVKLMEKSGTRVINNYENTTKAIDKAMMHLEFLSKGLQVPYSIIISPYSSKQEVELTLFDLARLGRPFIIKPATTTGGGVGVILGAETLLDVIESRQHHKNDKYLLQEKIIPTTLDGKRAWFRVLYVFGRVIPCWWNDETHVYTPVTGSDEQNYRLARLRKITRTIQSVCQLDFFSTEIALTADGRFVVVDYVNDMCDMRFQSVFPDGVPDEIVMKIITRIMNYIKSKIS
jgi:hypothetical protein